MIRDLMPMVVVKMPAGRSQEVVARAWDAVKAWVQIFRDLSAGGGIKESARRDRAFLYLLIDTRGNTGLEWAAGAGVARGT